jgi:hypothetical protein
MKANFARQIHSEVGFDFDGIVNSVFTLPYWPRRLGGTPHQLLRFTFQVHKRKVSRHHYYPAKAAGIIVGLGLKGYDWRFGR